MNLAFRLMKNEDILAVDKIERALFPDPWPAASFADEIKNNSISFPFVLENEKTIIGYAVCWCYCDELHIGNIAIRKPDQGKGIGRYFLKEIFNYFDEFKTAYLEVREANIKAIKLYKHFGFEVSYKRKNYYRNGEDALVMVKIKE